METNHDELEQFAYIVSHDLQEQVRNISNFTGLIAKHQGSPDDEEFRYQLNIVAESSAKLSGQLAALLTFSRIGRHQQKIQVDSERLVQDILKSNEAKIQECRAIVKVHDLPVVIADQKELCLIFENLITNALKFHSRHFIPEIYIRCQNKNENWEFYINDNGIGINEKYFQKIFLIFQKLHSSDEYPGEGTGLSFAKKAVEAHGGTIWLSTEPLGGTTFYFTIPKM